MKKLKRCLHNMEWSQKTNDLLGIKDKPKVDKKTDKEMALFDLDKANMKMDRDEIRQGLLNAKDEPFAEEVLNILDDKFKKTEFKQWK